MQTTAEHQRLQDHLDRKANWKKWGPCLSERAWGAVREDYSADGSAWEYFPHDHARSRAYRWGEDGIAGICDRHQYLCLSLALWNHNDPKTTSRRNRKAASSAAIPTGADRSGFPSTTC